MKRLLSFLLVATVTAVLLAGCSSDMTTRSNWFTLQQKGTIPKPCDGAPETNSNSMLESGRYGGRRP